MKITEIPYIIPVNPIDTKIKQSSFEEELKKAMVKTNDKVQTSQEHIK